VDHVPHFRQLHGFDLALLPFRAEFRLPGLLDFRQHGLAVHFDAVFALDEFLVVLEGIAAEGLDLKTIEHAVKAFSAQWSVAQMEKIRTVIIPNLKAEKAGV